MKEALAHRELLSYLKSLIQPGSSLLDVGCGPALYSSPFRDICNQVVTLDAWDKVNPDLIVDLEKTRLCDAVNHHHFDYIFMIDFIEHVDKSLGFEIIEDAKKLCKDKIFLLTPLPEFWNDNSHNVNNPDLWCHGNDFDLHKSVWEASDFTGWERITIKNLPKCYTGIWTK